MRHARLLFLVLGALCLAGCDDFSSPQGVVGTSYQAVMKGDLKTFRETLVGEALERLGTPEGLGRLRALFAGRQLSVESTRLVKSERDARGWTSLREFELALVGLPGAGRDGALGDDTLRFTAHVRCEVSYVYKERWGGGSSPFPGHPGPDYDCALREGHFGYCHFDEMSFCQVARLD